MSIRSKYMDIFGSDFDRLKFPDNVYFVAGGIGAQSILIIGSEKNALIDCGMAYCAEETLANISQYTDHVDYLLCSHSHYDHIGAIPYIADAYPDIVICGGAKTARVCQSEGARKFMKKMGENARDLYKPESDAPVRTDNFRVDRVLVNGDQISLGEETITVYETKGHTDCSMSFMLEPLSMLFASESTGMPELGDYYHTPILKSFEDAFASIDTCKGLKARYVCLPHFGMLPEDYNDQYFDNYRKACEDRIEVARKLIAEGYDDRQLINDYCERYKMPSGEEIQPYKAFAENAIHTVTALIKYVDENFSERDKNV